MKAKLLEVIRERAADRCEACGSVSATLESDHFFGRAKAEESEETIWRLCHDCHSRKTLNDPSAAYWIARFGIHCRNWSYLDALGRALEQLAWKTSKRRTA